MSNDAMDRAIDGLSTWIVREDWKQNDEPSSSMDHATREVIRQRVKSALKAELNDLGLVAVDPALVERIRMMERVSPDRGEQARAAEGLSPRLQLKFALADAVLAQVKP